MIKVEQDDGYSASVKEFGGSENRYFRFTFVADNDEKFTYSFHLDDPGRELLHAPRDPEAGHARGVAAARRGCPLAASQWPAAGDAVTTRYLCDKLRAMIRQIAVIGTGTMGRGIAYLAAVAGYETVIHDADAGALDAAKASIESTLQKGVERGKVTSGCGGRGAARGFISPPTSSRRCMRPI